MCCLKSLGIQAILCSSSLYGSSCVQTFLHFIMAGFPWDPIVVMSLAFAVKIHTGSGTCICINYTTPVVADSRVELKQ